MKNWNYINGASDVKVGNANYRYKGYLITKSDEDGEIIVYKPNGRDVAFRGTKSESIAKDWVDHHEVGNDTPAEYAKRPPKVVGGNSKCGNTARLIGEQKFKDLRVFYYKDDTDNVYYVSDKDQGPFGKIFDNGAFQTFEEAKRYVREKISRIPAYNSSPEEADKEFFHKLAEDAKEHDEAADKEIDKVGNSAYDDGAKKGKEDKRKGKLITAAGFDMHVPGFSKYSYQEKEEFKKGYYSENDLTKDDIYKKFGNKVGNTKEWEVKESDVIEYINGDPNATVIQRICAKHLGTHDTSGVQALLVDEKANKWAVVKRGANAKMKVGNRSWRTEKNGDRVTIYLNDWRAGWGEAQEWPPLGWITSGHTYGMTPSGMMTNFPFRKVYKDKKPSLEQIEKDLKEDFWAHHNNKETMEKVGNSRTENTWTPEQALKFYEEAKRTKDEKKMSEIREIIRQEKNAAYKHFQELDSRKEDILHNEAGYGRVAYLGDAKKKYEAWQDVVARIGNSSSDDKFAELYKSQEWQKLSDSQQKKIQLMSWLKSGKITSDEFTREARKLGNSATDDKFAYVMREFEEGKLKTPDGKVVTDPAQAKAIAYSESKKTENGLARARNAMAKNKKVGNVDLPKNVKKSDFSIRTFRENGAWSYEIKGPNGYKDGYHGFTEESIAKREAQEEIDFLVSGKEV